FSTGIFTIQYGVARFYTHRLIFFTWACGNYFAALWLFFCSIRNNDTSSSLLFCCSGLNDYPVVKRCNVYIVSHSLSILIFVFKNCIYCLACFMPLGAGNRSSGPFLQKWLKMAQTST